MKIKTNEYQLIDAANASKKNKKIQAIDIKL